eukprot:scaffold58635_cov21-Phaeocystis_antarctica.AAC.1
MKADTDTGRLKAFAKRLMQARSLVIIPMATCTMPPQGPRQATHAGITIVSRAIVSRAIVSRAIVSRAQGLRQAPHAGVLTPYPNINPNP